MRTYTAVLGLAVLGVLSCGAPAGGASGAQPPAASSADPARGAPQAPRSAEPIPLGRLPAGVRPLHQRIALDVDPSAARFGGNVQIKLAIDEPRDRIWLHGRGLAVSSVTLTTQDGRTLPAGWEEVDPSGVARVALPSPVSGEATLRIAFDAPYDSQLVGVYRVKTASGPAVFSKFEAIYARRAFPCFDEPGFKIPYDVALTVPNTDSVIGNLPLVYESIAGPARKQVRFATTPALPSYLIAFAVGPFDHRATTVPPSALRPTALPLRAVTIRGRSGETGYALGEAPVLLAEQERYFGVAFPFPKLDLIAVPDFQSGAMENAGAITFRDSALLTDERTGSVGQRFGITSVIAHELAHQWFGDLVTMRWWDDLWLNEGFATFLATRTLRAVRPDFEAELTAASSKSEVMNADSLASARRIRQPIETPHDITNAFDAITYQKGAAVIAMVEQFIGEQPFRRGLHEYLVAHAAGNATTDDLVASLGAAANRDLAPLFASFIDQPGVPVVTAARRCEAGRGRIELTQSRWRPIGAQGVPAGEGRWTIPVCVRAGIGRRVERVCTLLGERTGSIALPGCADWVMPNADAAGYYRAAMASEELDALRERGMPQLSVVERVQLASDLAAAFASPGLPGDEVLSALEPLARDSHGAVAVVALPLWAMIDEHIVEPRQRAALRAQIARLYAPALASLGWRPAAGERPWRRMFRSRLLEFLALEIEHPAVLAEAARLGRKLLGLDGERARLAGRDAGEIVVPDLAGLALAAAARKGGADVFDALLAELEHSDNAQQRQRLLSALGQIREPALVRRALDLALDPGLRNSERLTALRPLLGAAPTRDAAWSWLRASFDTLVERLPDRFAGRIPAMIEMCDPARAAEVSAFFAPRVEALTGGPRNLALALENAQQCAARIAVQRDSVRRYVR